MAAPQSSPPPYPGAVTAGLSADVEREAGQLALLLAERAGAPADPLAAASEVLALLAEALPASGCAVYRRREVGPPTHRTLEPVVSRGADGPRTRALAAAATRAVADGRLLVLPPTHSDSLPGERVLALPLGVDTIVGALALAWPRENGQDDTGRRVPLLIRLAPALLLALRPALRSVRGAARARSTAASKRGTDLLSLMSHELRTPLNTMNGFVEIVLDGLAGPLNDRQREFLRYAHTSTRHLIRLIEDILLLSRAEGQRTLLRRTPVAAVTAASRALTAAHEAATARDVGLVLTCAPDLPLLRADEARLAQALGNVLCFLVARAPSGSDTQLSVTHEDGKIVFSAEAAGPSLSPVELERLFAPFEPLHGTAPAGVTGLELAVARLIAERHGGALSARNRTGGGLALRLGLPLEAS